MNNLLHDMPVSIRRAMLIRWYICIYPSLSDPAIGYLVACNIAKVNDIMIQAIQLEQWIAQIWGASALHTRSRVKVKTSDVRENTHRKAAYPGDHSDKISYIGGF